MSVKTGQDSSSFRDPAGFIFHESGKLLRQVNEAGRRDYDALMQGGLYDELTGQGWLVKHQEVKAKAGAYKVLEPEVVPFISYPYEWSFSQLKDAALLTLQVQKTALTKGVILKDASAYNVQFVDGRPVLIDTLSFEPYGGEPAWKAYRQFCQHFLAPLALMAYTDIRLNSILRDYIDGVPLDLAVSALPSLKKARPGLFLHLVLHSRSQKKYAGQAKAAAKPANPEFAKRSLLGVIDSLERTVRSVKLPKTVKTEWGEYYTFTNYSDAAGQHKAESVAALVKQSGAQTVWDMGGNDGRFSRVALEAGAAQALCFDIDPVAVEKNYRQVKKDGEARLLPLLSDLTNPSPALGWAHDERQSLEQRGGEGNLVMALALIHHLAISNNLPFARIAEYFARLGGHLIIEFVPKDDSKVQILLGTREDIFDQYDQATFEAEFKKSYDILTTVKLKDTNRVLYLMKVK